MKAIGPILIFCFLLFVSSCQNPQETTVEIPAGVLDTITFAKVLRDFALAESAANINIKNVTVQKTDSVYAFDPLLENNVRKSQYDSTLSFYTAHPQLYKKVYDQVLVSLSEMQAKKNKAKADSIVNKQ